MNNYRALGVANTIFNLEFEQWKGEIFDYIKNTFEPSSQDKTEDDYTFFVDKCRWTVRYDRGIKCWLFFTGDGWLLNKYDTVGDWYINAEGSCSQWSSCPPDEAFIKKIHDEYRQLKSVLSWKRRK
ncbi:MAG: hypothetical protein FWD58_03445 [Firmicutes bacterium]|nr:hypothetical protein [Bacillota bacterium]